MRSALGRPKPIRTALAEAEGCLDGHPAFILGNGPFLPAKLDCLDGFFSVGVNRILERYDPTFLMWLDAKVTGLVEPYLPEARAVCIVRRQICKGRWIPLRASAMLAGPDTFVPCMNSGVSAAYWALTLGCRPVFLVGMSAARKGTETDFYGHNKYHVGNSIGLMRKAVQGILRLPAVHRIPDQQTLDTICHILRAWRCGRDWYLERTGVRSG